MEPPPCLTRSRLLLAGSLRCVLDQPHKEHSQQSSSHGDHCYRPLSRVFSPADRCSNPSAPGTALTQLGAGTSVLDVDSRVDLADGEAGTTRMDWQADVVVSGTIASVGARLLNSTVEKKTGELFECLKAQLEA